jgi:hypothetical protein
MANAFPVIGNFLRPPGVPLASYCSLVTGRFTMPAALEHFDLQLGRPSVPNPTVKARNGCGGDPTVISGFRTP